MNNVPPQANTAGPQAISLYQWLRIVQHVLSGLVTLSLTFPWLDRQKKDRVIQKWCLQLLKIFHLDLQVKGATLLPQTPYLLAANHISWIDIHVINSFRPVRFVAKAEVRSWPIFGWMAQQLGTVFIRRDNARHAREVVGELAHELEQESICIFPEGTSTTGASVLPFRPNLFEAAVVSQTPVYPMAIQYISQTTGLRSDIPAFIGEMGLLESMTRILKSRDLQAQITILEPFPIDSSPQPDRKRLASYCQEAISQCILQLDM
jgi:1-acyl-sn-glycerol-3-phosphate acyltransferase